MKTTTYALHVNLSASQSRKRLKGYGFGVRDIQATDRKQCVIIHTATGEHASDLESLFADVIVRDSERPESSGRSADGRRADQRDGGDGNEADDPTA